MIMPRSTSKMLLLPMELTTLVMSVTTLDLVVIQLLFTVSEYNSCQGIIITILLHYILENHFYVTKMLTQVLCIITVNVLFVYVNSWSTLHYRPSG